MLGEADGSLSDSQPIFVVGMPRSGTTLLTEVLDSHPRIESTPETHYFTRLTPRCAGNQEMDDRGVEEAISRFLSSDVSQDFNLGQGDGEACFDQLRDEISTHREFLQFIVNHSVRGSPDYWVEKTPEHIRYLTEIKRSFPEAKFLGIVRDPRDVSLSWSNTGWDDTAGPAYHALVWRLYSIILEDVEADPHSFVLRYESLIGEFDETCSQLFGFLGLPVTEEVIAFASSETSPTSFDPEREPWKRRASEPIDPSNKEKWKRDQDLLVTKCIELLTSAARKNWDYETSKESLRIKDIPRLLSLIASDIPRILRDALRNHNKVWETGMRQSQS